MDVSGQFQYPPAIFMEISLFEGEGKGKNIFPSAAGNQNYPSSSKGTVLANEDIETNVVNRGTIALMIVQRGVS
jgi:hypothetical protein